MPRQTNLPDKHSRHLHLLIPFALPTLAHTAETTALLEGLDLTGLEKLLQHAAPTESEPEINGDDAVEFQRTLPHERWLTRHFGIATTQQPNTGSDTAPLAPYMLLADGGEPGTACWACVEPVHIQIAHDHVRLLDPASLALTKQEAAQLLDDTHTLFTEAGLTVQAPTPLRWYISGAELNHLIGTTPLRASRHSLETQPSMFWMKLQNEVQMAWFEHPVNLARAECGLPTANSIWLHSQGILTPTTCRFNQVFSSQPATIGLSQASRIPHALLPQSLSDVSAHLIERNDSAPNVTLVELDMLTLPCVHEDWHAWRHALSRLENDWFAPAYAEFAAGHINKITLTLCSETRYRTFNMSRRDRYKFWRAAFSFSFRQRQQHRYATLLARASSL
jgi:hypothetical protein